MCTTEVKAMAYQALPTCYKINQPFMPTIWPYYQHNGSFACALRKPFHLLIIILLNSLSFEDFISVFVIDQNRIGLNNWYTVSR